MPLASQVAIFLRIIVISCVVFLLDSHIHMPQAWREKFTQLFTGTDGRPESFRDHIKRFKRSCMAMPFPVSARFLHDKAVNSPEWYQAIASLPESWEVGGKSWRKKGEVHA